MLAVGLSLDSSARDYPEAQGLLLSLGIKATAQP